MELPCGVYAPCHRPMCTGTPLRFSEEIELAVNRMYFPILKGDDGRKQHLLIFSDRDGRDPHCPNSVRKVPPQTLCRYLEAAMTQAVSSIRPDVDFTVSGNGVDSASPASAGYRASHLVHLWIAIQSSPGHRSATPWLHPGLSGCSSYLAPESTRAAVMGFNKKGRVSWCVWGNCSPRRGFLFHSTQPPTLVGAVEGRVAQSALRIRTYVNRVAFSHGFQARDVVELSIMGLDEVVLNKDAGYSAEASRSRRRTRRSPCAPPPHAFIRMLLRGPFQ